MRGVRKVAALLSCIVVLLLALMTAGVLVFTNTDWGRERTRRLVLSLVAKSTHGIVTVGTVQGEPAARSHSYARECYR